MPQATPERVRQILAQRYGIKNPTDDQIQAVLSRPEALKDLGLEPPESRGFFTRPLIPVTRVSAPLAERIAGAPLVGPTPGISQIGSALAGIPDIIRGLVRPSTTSETTRGLAAGLLKGLGQQVEELTSPLGLLFAIPALRGLGRAVPAVAAEAGAGAAARPALRPAAPKLEQRLTEILEEIRQTPSAPPTRVSLPPDLPQPAVSFPRRLPPPPKPAPKPEPAPAAVPAAKPAPPAAEAAAKPPTTVTVGGYEIDLTGLGPKLPTPAEFKAIVASREKLAAKLGRATNVATKELTELDRLGLEYRRTITERNRLERLLKSRSPKADPVLWQRYEQATRELGFRLQRTARELIRKAAGEDVGAIDPALLTRLTGVLTGGAIGAATGDDPDERIMHGILGAVGGGVGATLLTTPIPSVRAAIQAAARNAGQTIDDYRYFSMLSRPATIIRASSGAVSGMLQMVAERLAQGRLKDARAMVRSIFEEFGPTYLQALRDPSSIAIPGRVARKAPTGVLGLPLRLINAADAAAVRVGTRGGFTADEAARFTLAGTPTSAVGQRFVETVQTSLLRYLVPFPRVTVQMLERGLERTPLGLIPRVGKAIDPTLSTGTRVVRAATGTAATVAGFQLGDDIPPELLPFVEAAAGPLAIPLLLGVAARYAQERGQSIPARVLEQLNRQVPFAELELPTSASGVASLAGQFVPGIVSDVARVLDVEAPFGRETARETPSTGTLRDVPREFLEDVGRSLAAKVPGLRTRLPAKPAPRDIFGRILGPDARQQTAMERLLLTTPRPRDLPPRMDVRDPVIQEIRRLDISLVGPRRTVQIGGRTVELDEAAADEILPLKGRVMLAKLQAARRLILSAAYQRADDELKRTLLRTLFAQVDRAAEPFIRSLNLAGAAKTLSSARAGAEGKPQ